MSKPPGPIRIQIRLARADRVVVQPWKVVPVARARGAYEHKPYWDILAGYPHTVRLLEL